MSKLCDLFLDEHGEPPCADQEHQDALKRRRGGAAEWGTIERGHDAGGERDFLDGRAIHCGAGLVLQSFEYKEDDYGEYTVRLETGTRVRYELGIGEDKDGRRPILLFVTVGGHLFEKTANPWMRFRWPEVRR